MQYTVACNWDPELLDRIDYPEVKSVFSALPDTVISGGRSSVVTRNIDEDSLREYIKKIHQKGWSFDFNINSSCISNKEFTESGHKEILNYLEWAVNLGVDSFTVSIPLLVEKIKRYFPDKQVKISTYQKINTVAMAQRFEELGADAIMLSEHVNRDFELLKAIRRSVKCKIVLIANAGCIYGCANMLTHANNIAHSGAKGCQDTIFNESNQAYCLQKRLESTSELIKMRWIRPEDVSYYEEIGIDMLKIIDRNSSTEALAERVKAYNDRHFDGNLLDLVGQMINKKKCTVMDVGRLMAGKGENEIPKIRRFLEIFSICIPDLLYLNNKKIPSDFLKQFEQRNCANLSCSECGYCQKVADDIIRVSNTDEMQNALSQVKSVRGNIADGSILY